MFREHFVVFTLLIVIYNGLCQSDSIDDDAITFSKDDDVKPDSTKSKDTNTTPSSVDSRFFDLSSVFDPMYPSFNQGNGGNPGLNSQYYPGAQNNNPQGNGWGYPNQGNFQNPSFQNQQQTNSNFNQQGPTTNVNQPGQYLNQGNFGQNQRPYDLNGQNPSFDNTPQNNFGGQMNQWGNPNQQPSNAQFNNQNQQPWNQGGSWNWNPQFTGQNTFNNQNQGLPSQNPLQQGTLYNGNQVSWNQNPQSTGQNTFSNQNQGLPSQIPSQQETLYNGNQVSWNQNPQSTGQNTFNNQNQGISPQTLAQQGILNNGNQGPWNQNPQNIGSNQFGNGGYNIGGTLDDLSVAPDGKPKVDNQIIRFPGDNNSRPTSKPTTQKVSIGGKPVIVPTTTPSSYQITFTESAGDSASQKLCVQNCPTTSEYNPVCGSNKVSYYNPSRLICARNCGISVFQARSGNC